MLIKQLNLPSDKDFAFCVTLDDLHPESSKDSEKLDFGFSPKLGPRAVLKQLLTDFPEIKATLFAVPNWIDRSDLPSGILFFLRKIFRKRRNYPENKFNITDAKFTDWVRELNDFYPQNVEIAAHGLVHHNSNKKYARSQEFLGLSADESRDKIFKMTETFDKSGLRYTKGFRTPGWGANPEIYQVLSETGYIYTANTFNFREKVTRESEFIWPEKSDNGLLNYTANCYPFQIDRAVQIAKEGGVVVVHAHLAKTEYGLVSLDENFISDIRKMLKEIYFQTGRQPWFCTLGELTRQILNNNKVQEVEQESVSVVLTVYNGEKNVAGSLESLASQSYGNYEIIVVNDGSTDKTKEIVEKYISEHGNGKILLISTENNGRAGAKNTGLNAARGDLVTFCEDDAVYSPQYIKSAVEKFEDPGVLGVIGPHFVLNKKASLNTRVKDIERRRNFIEYKPNSCWFYKTEELKSVGGFDEKLEFGEDVEPALRLKKAFPERDFVFEQKAVWLHKEPVGLFKYLWRKFKGGLGMAVMVKLDLKKRIYPPMFTFVLLSVLIVFVGLLGYAYYIFGLSALFLLPNIFVMLWWLRWRDIIKSSKVTDESFFFVLFGLLIEYLWWFSTFLGVSVGKILTIGGANKLLRKR